MIGDSIFEVFLTRVRRIYQFTFRFLAPCTAATFSTGIHICVARSDANMLLDTSLSRIYSQCLVDPAWEVTRYRMGIHRHYMLRALRMLIFSWGVFAT